MKFALIPYELQLVCFILAIALSSSLLLAIKASSFASNHSLKFTILRWFCKKSEFWGIGHRGWYLGLLFLEIFGVLGTLLTIAGITFPYSFHISCIVGLLVIAFKIKIPPVIAISD